MRDMEFSDKVLDAASEAAKRAFLIKPKAGREEQFRQDIRYVLEAAARAEREEALAMAVLDKHGQNDGLGESLHTAWRKGTDSPYAPAIHRLISEMQPDDWHHYVAWVRWAWGVVNREDKGNDKAAAGS